MQDFRAAVQDLWSKAILAGSTVEEQAAALVVRLQEAMTPESAKELGAVLGATLSDHRRQLAEQVDAAVRRSLKLPPRAELKELGERLDVLEARIADLSGKENSPG